MKKGTKIVIVSLIVILIIGVLLSCGIVIYKQISQDESVGKSEEEIINIFKNNRNMFVETAESLYEFKFDWTLKQRPVLDIYVRDDWKHEYLNNRIELIIHGKDAFQNMPIIKENVEENKEIESIFKKLKFESIATLSQVTVNSNCIYFFDDKFGDIGSGIIYCPESLPQNPYITTLKEIEPGWYYFDSK